MTLFFCIFIVSPQNLLATRGSLEERAQHAINRGQVNELGKLLSSNFGVNDPINEGGVTLLHLAAADGGTVAMNFLIQKGANINCKDYRGITPLHNAAWRGNTLAIELLLSLHAPVDEKTSDCQTPLHYACWKGHAYAAQLLLKGDANINAVSSEGKSPLWYAINANAPDLVKLLLHNHNFSLDRLAIPELVRFARRGHDVILRLLDEYMSNEVEIIEPEEKHNVSMHQQELSMLASWIMVNKEDYEAENTLQ